MAFWNSFIYAGARAIGSISRLQQICVDFTLTVLAQEWMNGQHWDQNKGCQTFLSTILTQLYTRKTSKKARNRWWNSITEGLIHFLHYLILVADRSPDHQRREWISQRLEFPLHSNPIGYFGVKFVLLRCMDTERLIDKDYRKKIMW